MKTILISIIIIVLLLVPVYFELYKLSNQTQTSLAQFPHMADPTASASQTDLFNQLQNNIMKYKDLYANWIEKLETSDTTRNAIIPGIALIYNGFNSDMNVNLSNKYGVDIVSRIIIGRNDGTLVFDSMSDQPNNNINLRPSVMFVQTNESNIAFEKKHDYNKGKMEYYCAYRVGDMGTNSGTVIFSVIVNPKNTPSPTALPK
jgi:hypothetical protein